MALLYTCKWVGQGTDETKGHAVGYQTARAAANSLLFDFWNGSASSARKAAVDLDGKYYSAALTAGDLLYAVAGGVTSVKRLDSLAIGAANTVLTSSGSAPQWSTTLTLTALTVSNGIALATGNALSWASAAVTLTHSLTTITSYRSNLVTYQRV